MSEQWHYEQKGESYIKVDTLHKIRTLETELAAVTEQRDEARRLAEKYRNLSCQDQDQADATLLPWETNQSIEP